MNAPRVSFPRLQRTATSLDDETLLDAARRAGAPLGNACGGVGVCLRCRVRIVGGVENVSGRTQVEQKLRAEKKLRDDERLACQCLVRGDCAVTTDYW